jgi:aminoglycoside phosphotransferase (APT) family kinase protein
MTDVSNQIDSSVLARRLSAAAAAAGVGDAVTSVVELGGGSSGLTFTASLHTADGARTVVVKVAPPGLAPVRNRDVLRQAHILEALQRTSVAPVPHIVFTDAGEPPDVPPLFVMEHVDGVCFEPLVDATDELPAPTDLAGRATDAARILASIHSTDVESLGLSGEPVVGLVDELKRWERMLETSGIELGDLPQRTLEMFRERMPKPVEPRLVHGDYRLGNQICSGTNVGAVLDWEIWTISDPRIDIGWFLMTFEPEGLPSAIRSNVAGWPTSREVLGLYEAMIGAPVEDVRWFSALARLRSAAAMSLNVKHNRRRAEPSPRIEAYAAMLPEYLEAGQRTLGEG